MKPEICDFDHSVPSAAEIKNECIYKFLRTPKYTQTNTHSA